MKLIYLIPFFLLLSCSKENERQVCGQESQASFDVHNYSEFTGLNFKPKDDDVFYTSDYSGSGPSGITEWNARVGLRGVCNTDVPKIHFSVTLKSPLPNFKVNGYFTEDDPYYYSAHINLTSTDGLHFIGEKDLNFEKGFNGSKIVSAKITSFITSLGSYQADRDYFFLNLESMSCTIKAHRPE